MNKRNVKLAGFSGAAGNVTVVEATTGELAEWLETTNFRSRDQGAGWAGGTRGDAVAYLRCAKRSPQQAMVESLVDRIDASFRDRDAQQWMPSVAGAYPMVPEYLMGMPENMRQRVAVESDVAPIRLFVSISAGANVEVDALAKRGAAVAALAMRLSEARPVELYATFDVADRGTCASFLVRVPLENVGLAEVAALFATPATMRNGFIHLAREVIKSEDSCLPQAWWPGHEKAVRQLHGLSDADVVLPPLMRDGGEFSDPVKWVHDKLESQREIA